MDDTAETIIIMVYKICICSWFHTVYEWTAVCISFVQALGYHLIPKGSNELGQVALVLARKEEEVAAAQQQVVDTMHRILGSRPTLSVCVEGIKPLPEDR